MFDYYLSIFIQILHILYKINKQDCNKFIFLHKSFSNYFYKSRIPIFLHVIIDLRTNISYDLIRILRTWRYRYTFHRRLVNYRGRVASCGDLVSPDTCTRCATSIYTVGTQLGTSHGWWALAGRGKRLLVIVICHLSPAIPTMSAWEMANPRFVKDAARYE